MREKREEVTENVRERTGEDEEVLIGEEKEDSNYVEATRGLTEKGWM